jgi:hypothetical protein
MLLLRFKMISPHHALKSRLVTISLSLLFAAKGGQVGVPGALLQLVLSIVRRRRRRLWGDAALAPGDGV